MTTFAVWIQRKNTCCELFTAGVFICPDTRSLHLLAMPNGAID